MNELQHAKYVAAIPPAAIIDNAAATVVEVDATGYDYATFVVSLGATDIAMTALKVQNSATSGGSFADISGADFDGGTDSDGGTLALPSATDDNQICVFQVNLQGRNRYLQLSAAFGDGTAGGFVSAVAILSKGQGPLLTNTEFANGGVCRV